ncbi:YnfA family protein [Entomobacter blattae]|uniref:Uncharacterized protein n=1 Tax=Entomobacter blattae TaxID=2762277 RepID=A0A7H1NR46_9PROT|nr:YnfA family protein [Entomobacter blattae]QNT78256.1 hypothetical protein JGUZn3_10280 [Entomobacter blattae]
MKTLLIALVAAFAEISGCFVFWTTLRLHKSFLWLMAGLALLSLFAGLLSHMNTPYAGRAFAAYGGIYIACCLVWMGTIERTMPDLWDITGAALAIAGCVVILFAPHS